MCTLYRPLCMQQGNIRARETAKREGKGRGINEEFMLHVQ